jgi:uncharacterized membrane protein YhaH (DUF805 family)
LQFMAIIIMPIKLLGVSEHSNSIFGWVTIYIEFLISAVIIIPLVSLLVSRLLKISNTMAWLLSAFGTCLFTAWVSGLFSLSGISELINPGSLVALAQLLTIFALFFISYKALSNNSHNKSLKKGLNIPR